MTSEQGKSRIGDCPPPPVTIPPNLDDWNNWRPVITHLWQTSPTCEELRAVMAREYCFIDSSSSFKSHLKEWGLRKSTTREDIFYLAMVIRDRGLDDVNPIQRPLFFLHGRQYPYYCVARSLKRWGCTLDSFGTTPPRPSHILIVDPEIPRSPTTPTEFALSEKILFQTHYIYGGCLDETRQGSSDLKRCQSAFGWALQAVNEGDYACARTHFCSSLDCLAEALKQRSQHLLPLICVSTALAHAEPSDLAKGFLDKFFRCALDLVRHYCGGQHPFAIALESLSSTQRTGHVCVMALRKTLDSLYARNHGHIETIEEIEIMLSDALRVLGKKTEALSHCHKVVKYRENLYPLYDPKILGALNNLVNCHFRFGDFQDAENILSSIIGDDAGSQFRWPRVYHFFELMRLQAQVMDAQGRHQESERLLGRTMRELWSPYLDLDNAEAILHSIARMMSQVSSPAAVKWIRAWIPQVKNMTAQRAPDLIRECLNSLVVEYYMVVSIRQLHTETGVEGQGD